MVSMDGGSGYPKPPWLEFVVPGLGFEEELPLELLAGTLKYVALC